MSKPAHQMTGVKDSNRFEQLWQRSRLVTETQDNSVESGSSFGASLHSDIVRAYAEPQRKYHTMGHIEHCLRQLDLARASLGPLIGLPEGGAEAVELAIWFHDVIYDPDASDNEPRSAELFVSIADGVLAPETVPSVDRMIMATMHVGMPGADDERLMVDVDLSSFGMPWDKFYRDSIDVRAEMSHLSESRFAIGHARFLKGLLERESIYSTDFFRDLYEARARENITSYISTYLS